MVYGNEPQMTFLAALLCDFASSALAASLIRSTAVAMRMAGVLSLRLDDEKFRWLS